MKSTGSRSNHWLDILNQDSAYRIIAGDTMVLMYKGREWFFVDGGIGYVSAGKGAVSYGLEKACVLIAVGQSAVGVLSEQKEVFRLISGSAELAAFSVFRWSDFVYMLMAERK